MRKSGKIQMQFKPTVLFKERNEVVTFSGIVQFFKMCYKVFQKKPDKVFIFFDPTPTK